jgi:putative ABC transport system ATP-binding protein
VRSGTLAQALSVLDCALGTRISLSIALEDSSLLSSSVALLHVSTPFSRTVIESSLMRFSFMAQSKPVNVPLDSESAIRAEGIEMIFPSGDQSLKVLKGIDLTIKMGDIQLLMGPSGSGKTTLLSILGGILTPTAGQVFLLGQEITELPRRELARFRLHNIGFIFQGFNLFPALTAAENIEAALNLKGCKGRDARKQALKLLEQVGLADKTQSLPNDLSGGQKQRIAIARSLAGKPRLILADEPTAALDSQRGRAVIELLRSLAKEEGCTVVMVTHDSRIMDIADRVVYVEDGTVSTECPPNVSSFHSA